MNLKILIALAALLASSLACADELPLFQIAAHGGYRAGGSFEDSASSDSLDLEDGTSLALALEFRFGKGDDRYLQLWYSHQSSSISDGVADHDVDVENLHFGGTVPVGDMEKAQGYFAMGIGATRFSATGAGAEDQTKFSASVGLGLAIPVSKRAAIRLEARGYVTFVDTDTSIFCRSDNGTGFCRIVASSSAIYQAEVLAGIAVSF